MTHTVAHKRDWSMITTGLKDRTGRNIELLITPPHFMARTVVFANGLAVADNIEDHTNRTTRVTTTECPNV